MAVLGYGIISSALGRRIGVEQTAFCVISGLLVRRLRERRSYISGSLVVALSTGACVFSQTYGAEPGDSTSATPTRGRSGYAWTGPAVRFRRVRRGVVVSAVPAAFAAGTALVVIAATCPTRWDGARC